MSFIKDERWEKLMGNLHNLTMEFAENTKNISPIKPKTVPAVSRRRKSRCHCDKNQKQGEQLRALKNAVEEQKKKYRELKYAYKMHIKKINGARSPLPTHTASCATMMWFPIIIVILILIAYLIFK